MSWDQEQIEYLKRDPPLKCNACRGWMRNNPNRNTHKQARRRNKRTYKQRGPMNKASRCVECIAKVEQSKEQVRKMMRNP